MKKILITFVLSLGCAFISVFAADDGRIVVGIVDSCPTSGVVQVRQTYIKAVENAGFTPVILPYTAERKKMKSLIADVDILLLVGGEDVAPARYSHPESPKLGRVNLKRDAFEFGLLEEAKAVKLPVFGICRGCQVINVFFGGTLYQDIPSEITVTSSAKVHHCVAKGTANPVKHVVSIKPGTRFEAIVGSGDLIVNSYHHQSALDLAPGFVASAVARDGVVEAIESIDYPAAGVQFHPEAALASGSRDFDLQRLGEIFARLPELVGMKPVKNIRIADDIIKSTDDETLLKAFISIPSVTGDIPQVNRMSEAMMAHLKAHGLKCTMETMPDGLKVLYACSRDTKKPDVLISAHLDVVRAQSPSMYTATVTNGVLYGRGASDCKGHCVLAARLLRELKDDVSIGCIFGSDEEHGGKATRWMVTEKGYGARKVAFVLDMEPYSITTRQKGLASYCVKAVAPARHTGLMKGPLPKNALDIILLGQKKLAELLPSYEDGSWRDTARITSIKGNSVSAEAWVYVKNSKNDDWSSLEKKIAQAFPGCEITNKRKSPAVILDEADPVLNEFLRRTKEQLCDGKGHRYDHYYHLDSSTDARHLQDLGVPLIITGTDCHGGHTSWEHMNLWSMKDYFELISGFVLDFYREGAYKPINAGKVNKK